MKELRILLLGTPRIEVRGAVFAGDRRKAVALLAYLAVAGGVHRRESLAALFWPDSDQARALAYLRRTIWELNNGLGEGWLITDREQVELRLDDHVWLDVAEFQEQARSGSISGWKRATELYRGDFLAGFALADSPEFDEWQAFQAEALRQSLASVLAQLAEALATEGDYEAAIAAARRRLTLDLLEEAAHRQLMRLYAAQGWRAAAIRQYEQCVQLLTDELGVSPERETEALYQQIVRGELRPAHSFSLVEETQALPADEPKDREPQLISLPVPPTSFVGREPELAEIGALLAESNCRLLTLLGPGGSGKTRLAIESAARRASGFGMDVCFVPLAPLESTDSILPAVARALDFSYYKEDRSPREQLLDYLCRRQILLVLDNFEHVLAPESLEFVMAILRGAPNVQLLVTSRTRLNVQGEQLYSVAGMRAPGAEQAAQWHELVNQLQGYSAIQLFLERARRVRPGFVLEPANLVHVVKICQAVQGMPLGIELAATWLELLSPAEIEAEIRRSLDFLETDQEGVPERQRSLRAVFETSWELLTPEERDAFQRLAIFRGGFTREAAQTISRASLRTLLALVNKSWLERDAEQRYRVHELLRQYAAEKLRSDEMRWLETRRLHAEFYGNWMRRQADVLRGKEQLTAIGDILADFENVRLAWVWHVEQGKFESLGQQMLMPLMLWALHRFSWEVVSPLVKLAVETINKDNANLFDRATLSIAWALTLGEMWEFAEARQQAQEAWDVASDLRPDELIQLGSWFAHLAMYYSWAVDRYEGVPALRNHVSSLREQGERWELGFSLYAMGTLCSENGVWDEALTVLAEAEQIFSQLGDQIALTAVLAQMSDIARTLGHYEDALKLLQRARGSVIESGNQPGLARLDYVMAEVYLQLGNIEQAIVYYRELQQLFKSLGNQPREFHALHWRCLLYSRYRPVEEAMRLRQQHWQATQAAGIVSEHAWSTWELGELYRIAGDITSAEHFFRQSYAYMSRQKHDLGIAFYHRGLGDLALMRSNFADALEHFERYYQLALSEHYNWSVAYALTGLGRAATGMGDFDLARSYLTQSVQHARDEGTQDLCMLGLAALAELHLRSGNTVQAAELAGFVYHHKLTWRNIREQAGAVLAEANAVMLPETCRVAEQRGQSSTLADVLEDLLPAQASSQAGSAS